MVTTQPFFKDFCSLVVTPIVTLLLKQIVVVVEKILIREIIHIFIIKWWGIRGWEKKKEFQSIPFHLH